MPKSYNNFPQGMCTTIVQTPYSAWVNGTAKKITFATVDKHPHLYTQYHLPVHHAIHSLKSINTSVKNRFIPTMHMAYKELITSKLKPINN